jgi:hypothetical protein
MKQSALNEVPKKVRELRLITEADSDNETWSYAKELRTLGQVLEAHQLSSVELEVESGVYFVRGKATVAKAAESSLAKLVHDFVFGPAPASKPREDSDLKLRYTANEIKQLDGEGQSKRKDAGKTPDPHSLSQVLRGAGAYLDEKRTSLVGITVRDRWITIRYKTADGTLEKAKQDIEYFFNYWVKMYCRRKNRAKSAPPNDPTLVVTWEGIKKQNPTY